MNQCRGMGAGPFSSFGIPALRSPPSATCRPSVVPSALLRQLHGRIPIPALEFRQASVRFRKRQALAEQVAIPGGVWLRDRTSNG